VKISPCPCREGMLSKRTTESDPEVAASAEMAPLAGRQASTNGVPRKFGRYGLLSDPPSHVRRCVENFVQVPAEQRTGAPIRL